MAPKPDQFTNDIESTTTTTTPSSTNTSTDEESSNMDPKQMFRSTQQNEQSRLSKISQQYDRTNKGFLDKTERALRELDTENKGQLDMNRIYTIMKELQEQQHQSMTLKRMVVGLVAFTVILAVSNLATAFAAVTLAKETKMDEGGVMRVKSSGRAVSTRNVNSVIGITVDEENDGRVLEQQRALYEQFFVCDDSDMGTIEKEDWDVAWEPMTRGSSPTFTIKRWDGEETYGFDTITWTRYVAPSESNQPSKYRFMGYTGRAAEDGYQVECDDKSGQCTMRNCLIGAYSVCASSVNDAVAQCTSKPYCDGDNDAYLRGDCFKRCDGSTANMACSLDLGHECVSDRKELDVCEGESVNPYARFGFGGGIL